MRTGAIVLPQYVDMGSAYTKDANLDSWKVSDIEKLSEGDNFVDESGKSIRDKIIDAYIEKKNEHGTLPGVAFASTIEHARQIVEAFEAKGIRAARVTSGSGDISSKEATRRMDNGELDVIVTVTKVSEGFDYPPLACALWFCPSLSPAKIFQGNGRIMRATHEKIPKSILDEDGKIVPSPNSYIIAPSAWYAGSSSYRTNEDGNAIEEITETGDPFDKTNEIEEGQVGKKKLPRIGNFYELLVERKEMDINSIGNVLRSVIDLGKSLRCEPGEEVEIDGIVYVGLTKSSEELDGYNMRTMLEKALYKGIPVILSRQNNGMQINLVPKEFINKNKKSYICALGETIVIDGIEHIGVVRAMTLCGLFGGTIIKKAQESGIIIVNAKQPQSPGRTSQNINLIPKWFIESLKTHTKPGERKIIGEEEYIGIVDGSNIEGLMGKTIIGRYKAINPEIKKVPKRGKGKGEFVYLIPMSFINQIKSRTKCNPGETVIINNVDYVGITSEMSFKDMRGGYILEKAKKMGIMIIEGVQKNEKYKVNLIPKSYIEKLKSVPKSGDTFKIDGVDYIRIIDGYKIDGINGSVFRNRAKIDQEKIIEIILADGITGRFITKKYKEKLTQTVSLGERVEIDGIWYIGMVSNRQMTISGIKTKTILDNARKRKIGTLSRYKADLTPITLVPESFVNELSQKKK